MNVPNYLHIGYSKAASSWFQNFLRNQQDVFMVYKSDFFSPLDSVKFAKGLTYYSKYFKGSQDSKIRIESNEHIILPFYHPELHCASTNLEVVEKNARRIKTVLPNIKIIVIIRNQLDMLLSRYTQYVLQGGKLSAEEFFSKLLFDNKEKLKYVDYRYFKVITSLYQIFGKENVCVLFQEELKRSPQKFLDQLCDYFNISLSGTNKNKQTRKNAAPSLSGIKLLRLLNKSFVTKIETYNSKTKTWGPYFIWYLLGRGIRVLDHLLIKNKRKKFLISKTTVHRMQTIFAEDNKKLSILFKKPLHQWGYFYHEE